MSAQPPPELPQSGDRIGPYLLQRQLGAGGATQGPVFLAEHTGTGRHATLALLRPEHRGVPAARERFFAEPRVLAALKHENLVEVLDILDEPWPCFVVEELRGHPLNETMKKSGKLQIGAALHVGWQLCMALRAAHDAGLVHKTLRPSCVFLVNRAGARGVVKLVDFASSSLAAFEDARPYLAPEVASGAPADARADTYAYGCVLYELVTGRPPFAGRSAQALAAAHANEKPQPPDTLAPIPLRLNNLILSCLEKDPAGRPLDMLEVAGSLRDVAGMVDPHKPATAVDEPSGDFALPSAAGWVVVPGQQARPTPVAGLDEVVPHPAHIRPAATPSVAPSLLARTRTAPPLVSMPAQEPITATSRIDDTEPPLVMGSPAPITALGLAHTGGSGPEGRVEALTFDEPSYSAQTERPVERLVVGMKAQQSPTLTSDELVPLAGEPFEFDASSGSAVRIEPPSDGAPLVMGIPDGPTDAQTDVALDAQPVDPIDRVDHDDQIDLSAGYAVNGPQPRSKGPLYAAVVIVLLAAAAVAFVMLRPDDDVTVTADAGAVDALAVPDAGGAGAVPVVFDAGAPVVDAGSALADAGDALVDAGADDKPLVKKKPIKKKPPKKKPIKKKPIKKKPPPKRR